ncbi:MAG: enoyl-CoA hydratase/isomerase family protein, partial [Halobacteriaceae archaeon]
MNNGLEDSYETIEIEVDEPSENIVTVYFSRPDARNALNAQMRSELKSVIDAIEESPMRVVIVTGSPNANAFVAGADVKELHQRNGLEQREASKRPRVYEYIDDLSQPVIARINGHALGGGCELAQACDIRIAQEDAKLGQPEINLGIMPGGGA